MTAILAPDALRLVPVEPTEAMLKAGQAEWLESGGGDPSHDVYRAMLAASPAVQPAAGREEIAGIIRDAIEADDNAQLGGTYFEPGSDRMVYRYVDIGCLDLGEIAARILSAISTPAQASETGGEDWRPINDETPHNEDILVCMTHNLDDSERETLQWVDSFDGEAGWFTYPRLVEIPFPPTHWHPLPAPPALSAPQAAPGEGEG